MGEIEKFRDYEIYINSDDHEPPHVHIVDLNDTKFKTRLRIDNGDYVNEKDMRLRSGYAKLKKRITKEIHNKCIYEWNKLHPDIPYKEDGNNE